MNRLHPISTSLSGINTAPILSDETYSCVMVADTDTTVTVPTNANYAVVSCTGTVYVGSSEVILPAGNTLTKRVGQSGGTVYQLKDITTLHFRSAGTPSLDVSFYS